MNSQLVQTIGVVLGVMLAIPILVILVQVAMFAGSLKSQLNAASERVTEFITRIDKAIENHDERIIAMEAKLLILWDGHNRRTGKGRRQSDNAESDTVD